MTRSCAAAWLALLLLGCGPAAYGEFTGQGFHHSHGYRVAYPDDARGALLGEDWRIESHEAGGSRPGAPKTGDDHVTTLWLDLDDDGELDDLGSAFSTDVTFERQSADARIWLEAFPLDASESGKPLKVLAERFVEQVASMGRVRARVQHGAEGTKVEIVEDSRIATKLLDSRALGVGGQPAHVVLFDGASTRQLELDAATKQVRVAAVLVRTPMRMTVQAGGRRTVLPMLLMIGYASTPEAFDSGMPALTDLLKRIQFDQGD